MLCYSEVPACHTERIDRHDMKDHVGDSKVVCVRNLSKLQQVTATHTDQNVDTVHAYKSKDGFADSFFFVRERSCPQNADLKECCDWHEETKPSQYIRGLAGKVIHREKEAI